MKVLIVDGDRTLVDLVVFVLGHAGIEAVATADTEVARRLLASERPDLVVMDATTGGGGALELLTELRRSGEELPVMLTGRGATEDERVRGLELGADDYLVKPFGHRELIARIGAVLRRQVHAAATRPTAGGRLQAGPLLLDADRRTVTNAGRPVRLTATEFRLLHFLMANTGRVVPGNAILRHVWGSAEATGSDLVRVTLHRLRRKLGEDPTQPRLLETIPGVGVLLHAVPDEPQSFAEP